MSIAVADAEGTPGRTPLFCRNGHSLAVPQLVKAVFEAGEEVTVSCTECRTSTVVDTEGVVEYTPHDRYVGWTEVPY